MENYLTRKYFSCRAVEFVVSCLYSVENRMAVLVTDKIGDDPDSVCRGSASPSMGTTQSDCGHIVFLELAIQHALRHENFIVYHSN